MANLEQISQFCRLCLVKDDVNTPIFDDQEDIRQIYLKISSCLPVKISKEDNLPKKICGICTDKLDTVYAFWKITVQSEKQLIEWLKQIGVETGKPSGSLDHTNKVEPLILKQEIVDPIEIRTDGDGAADTSVSSDSEKANVDTAINKQKSQTSSEACGNIDEPPTKRARRAAAFKRPILEPDSEEEDDPIEAKVEDYSDDSDGEDNQDDNDPDFVLDNDDHSNADDQPGPSGVGKSEEPPSCDPLVMGNLVYGPSMSIIPLVKTEQIDEDDDDVIEISQGTINYQSQHEKNSLMPSLKNDVQMSQNTINYQIQHAKNSLIPSLKILLKHQKNNIVQKIKKKKKIGEPVKNVNNIFEHIEGSLSEPVHCEMCDQTYPSNVLFALHSIEHNIDNKYACHFCDYKNSSKYHIVMHVKAHEGTTKYKCEICNKAFTVSTHAVEHKYFHTGEKPFQCEICGKHFMFSWFLTSHRRTQHWEIMTGMPLVKYDCTICNKHYTSSTGLKRHNLSKHNESGSTETVLCDICGKQLSSMEKLKFHRRTHTGYKPYQCVVCTKSFTKKEQLKEHERVHTGERPYICKFCGKGFTQRSPLRIHERIHTGERPYICRVCTKGFISKGVMDTHMKTCTGPFILPD